MKKFSLKLLLFILLLWLLTFGLFLPIHNLYFSSNGGNSGAQINYAIRDQSDILIIGSSRAAHHYDSQMIAKYTGLKVYNAGKEGVNSSYQYGLMHMYLNKNTPRLIVYDVCDFGPNLDSGTSYLFPHFYKDHQVRSILRERYTFADLKFLFPIYAYNGKLFDIVYDKLRRNDFSNFMGFEPRDKSIKTNDIKLLTSQMRLFQGIDSLAVKHFKENIIMIRERKIPVVFIYSPTLLDEKLGGLEIVQQVAIEQDIDFYNYWRNDRYYHKFDYFYDALHLNASGAENFSKEVAAIISNILNKRD